MNGGPKESGGSDAASSRTCRAGRGPFELGRGGRQAISSFGPGDGYADRFNSSYHQTDGLVTHPGCFPLLACQEPADLLVEGNSGDSEEEKEADHLAHLDEHGWS